MCAGTGKVCGELSLTVAMTLSDHATAENKGGLNGGCEEPAISSAGLPRASRQLSQTTSGFLHKTGSGLQLLKGAVLKYGEICRSPAPSRGPQEPPGM